MLLVNTAPSVTESFHWLSFRMQCKAGQSSDSAPLFLDHKLRGVYAERTVGSLHILAGQCDEDTAADAVKARVRRRALLLTSSPKDFLSKTYRYCTPTKRTLAERVHVSTRYIAADCWTPVRSITA